MSGQEVCSSLGPDAKHPKFTQYKRKRGPGPIRRPPPPTPKTIHRLFAGAWYLLSQPIHTTGRVQSQLQSIEVNRCASSSDISLPVRTKEDLVQQIRRSLKTTKSLCNHCWSLNHLNNPLKVPSPGDHLHDLHHGRIWHFRASRGATGLP